MKVDFTFHGQRFDMDVPDSQVREYATSQLGMVRPGPATRCQLASEAQLATAAHLQSCRERFEKAEREHARAHSLEESAARFSFLQTADGQDLWELMHEAELKDTAARSKLALANIAR